MNVELRDALDFLLAPPKVSVGTSSPQTVTTGISTIIDFTAENWDYTPDPMHESVTWPNRVTATTAGAYLVSGIASFESNATGYRSATIRVNGSLVRQYRIPAASGAPTEIGFAYVWSFAEDDYAELQVFQNSGGDRAVGAALQMSWIGATP
jgi:hypothetical protein